ncbi:MAG: cation-translocating P-type ATPase [Oscillospiraceae bacterium]
MKTVTEERKEYIGLTQAEAERAAVMKGEVSGLRKKTKKKTDPLKIFAGQFHDVMVIILLIAAAISVAAGGWSDAVPIILIVVMNAALGFFQEYRCEKTLEQMEKLTAPTAKVYRDGELRTIAAEEVVEGDVFEVEAGDRFPADCLILSQTALSCDESLLTGETLPAVKSEYKGETDRRSLNLNYVGYMGTTVLKGRARCEAFAVGENTQMGGISDMLSNIAEEQTPLQKRLGELGKMLAFICLAVCAVVFAAGVIRGENIMEMFFTAVTIAIAAIPEGLPAAVTIALALAVRRMLKQNALVHKLHSVETLGCADVICTDKTGTLTKNRMTVRKIKTFSDGMKEYSFVDDGVKGLSAEGGGRVMAWDDPVLSETLLCAALCNNSKLVYKTETTGRRKRKVRGFDGDPTEAALLELCAACGVDNAHIEPERIGEKPFDSESRYMSVTCRDKDGRRLVFIKGAPEVVAGMCSRQYKGGAAVGFGDKEKSEVLAASSEYAAQGLRVIAFCESAEGDTVFLGLAALSDPLRPQAAEAVLECRRAGITTVMITGDHKLTACAVAREAGILTSSKRAVTGEELDGVTDEQLADEISDIAVFARVTPAHKLRIVRAFKKNGSVCAMTGDGVNDAPAVKEASIGVAMGLSGTDVTKQAADMILLDDNFATLVSAVREGRTIYANIRKFVRYLIACNIGEVLTMFGAIIMGLPIVLVPAQLLLVNLVTDGLPAAALSVEPPEKGVMRKPPRSENDSFFSGGLLTKILTRGVLIALCTLACFTVLLTNGCTLAQSRTGAMLTLVLSQLIHVFECRSEDKTLFETGLKGCGYAAAAALSSLACVIVCIAVPRLASMFSLSLPGAEGLVISALLSAAVPVVSGIIGFVKNKKSVLSEK